MEKRLILALIFSVLILAMWSIIFPQPKQQPLQPPPAPRAKQAPLFTPREDVASKSQPIVQQEVRRIRPGEEIGIDTPLYRAEFSKEGGELTSFQLRNYPEEHIRLQDIDRAIVASRDEDLKMRLELLKELLPQARGIEMVSLFSKTRGNFPLSLIWQDENIALYEQCEVAKQRNKLIFTFIKDDLKIIKQYTFRDDTYLIDIEIKFINNSEKTFKVSPLLIQYGPGIGLSTDPFGKGDLYHKGLVLIKEAGREKVIKENFRRGKKGQVQTRSYPQAIWAGLENKYFIAAFLPPDEPHSFLLEKDAYGQLNTALKMQMPEIIPGGVFTKRFSLYLGPKQHKAIKLAGGGLEKSLNYGMLASSLRIMDILRFFYRLSRNWGVAIILLTIVTKIILLPLTQKSLRSMEKMQKLQPRMKEFRLKYKDDPKRMNKELMDLYRREGVNPMGGCLPMLMQMPIFIALFTTLRNTIDLRGAAFLWIKDLSIPDTVCYLGGIPLNPLPLVMGLSMFWQQKMSTADPEQAKMMAFMPFFFTVMFYKFSSGLVLYWFVQNILTIAHQYGMRKVISAHEKS
jgi:YidC/Oxa1 family membrane protein insertase